MINVNQIIVKETDIIQEGEKITSVLLILIWLLKYFLTVALYEGGLWFGDSLVKQILRKRQFFLYTRNFTK